MEAATVVPETAVVPTEVGTSFITVPTEIPMSIGMTAVGMAASGDDGESG